VPDLLRGYSTWLGEWGEGVEWMGEGMRMNGSVEPERIDGLGRGERLNGWGEQVEGEYL
jgi:hypothetical protein